MLRAVAAVQSCALTRVIVSAVGLLGFIALFLPLSVGAQQLPSVSVDDVSVIEGNSGTATARFTFRLSAASTQTVSVRFATANGTATAGSDYSSRSGTTTFSPGETSRTQSFTINGDLVAEADETFFINLNTPVGLTIAKGQGSATIRNDDAATGTMPDTFSFSSVTDAVPGSVQTSNAITVTGINDASPISVVGGSYAVNDGAFVSTSGTVTAGQTVRVQQTASNTAATTARTTLTIGGVSADFAVTTAQPSLPSVSIDDVMITEGNSGAATARFTFRLSAASKQTVSVRFATANGTATAGADYTARTGTTTFAPGETSRTQSFTIISDTVSEIDETFVVNLLSPAGLIIAKGQGVATIINDDQAPDTMPDTFGFAPTVDVPLGSLQTSSAITVSGINAAAPVSIVGGYYSINGSAYSDSGGSASNGALITIQVMAAYGFSETRTATLNIGGVSGTYSVTTQTFSADGTPDAFAFEPSNGVPSGSAQRSQPIKVSGINVAVPISVTGGRYRINDGAFTSEPGQVVDGDTVTAEVQASDEGSTTNTVTVSIGGVSADFSATTVGFFVADPNPDAFTFAPTIDVAPGSIQFSEIVMVSGINTATAISISGGRYSVNGGGFTAAVGSIEQGDSIVVEQIASEAFATSTEAVLTIGDVRFVYGVTTRNADITPDTFAFAPAVDAALGSTVSSAEITIVGIDEPVPVAIVGGQYSIGGSAFTESAGEIRNGDVIRVRVLGSAAYATTVAATLTIGGVSATFDVTTLTADITPDAFSFKSNPAAFPLLATISEPVIVSGITAPVTASISGGEYSVNGAPFLTMPGPVSNGDRVRLLVIPGANRGDVATASLSLGGVSGMFTVTADAPADDFPDVLTFRNTTGPRNSLVSSEAGLIRGINVPTPISVSGGSYSINGGPFTSAPSTVRGGDWVTLQMISSSSYNSKKTVTLSIGGSSAAWAMRTESDAMKLQAFTLVNASMFAGGQVLPESLQTTVPITVYNPPAATAISIAGGSYSINGGAFSSAAGTVVSGDQVVVQFRASASYATQTSVTLNIGTYSSTLSVISTIDPVAATPTEESGCESYVYRDQPPVPLRIFVCKPPGWQAADHRSALMHWFGGGFTRGNADASMSDARYWSRTHGMVGIAPDYRVNERFGTYAYVSADDGRAAVKWVQDHAAELGIDPARVVVSGSSAGGGVAFFTAMRNAPITGTAADNPVLRPAAVLTRAGIPNTSTEPNVLAYGSSFRFGALAATISPSANLDADFPPVLITHGDHDTTVAATPSVHVCSALIRLGRICEFNSKPGKGHDLLSDPGEATQLREETRVFLTKLGLLPALRQ